MLRFFICLVCILLSSLIYSQHQSDSIITYKQQNNNVFLNLAGANGSIISLSYERLIRLNPGSFLAINIGFGYSSEYRICKPCEPKLKHFLIIPHQLSLNLGRLSYYFEMGVGGSYISGITYPKYIVYPFIAFRVQPVILKRTLFRVSFGYPIGYTLIGGEHENFLFIPVGLTFGKSF